MNMSVHEYRLQAMEDYIAVFGGTKWSVVLKFCEPLSSHVVSDEGLYKAITRSPEIEKALTLKLGECYKEEPSLNHLQKYARFQLEEDMGI